MTLEQKILAKLLLVEEELRNIELWQETAPHTDAFESVEPFCIDTMDPHEWLQWILLPRLTAMIENNAPLPTAFEIAPYYEEAFKNDESRDYVDLLNHLRELDALFGS